MIHIDHISIAARNIYESADRLRAETGLGFYDGGWTESGLGSKIFPLGGGAYLQVEGIVDPHAIHDPKKSGVRRFFDSVASGEHFRGLGLRVDSMEELEDVAKRRGSKIYADPAGRIRPDGTRINVAQTPSIGEAWSRGLPNWYFFPELNFHPAGQRVIPAHNLVQPLGIAWIEAGGSAAEMERWLGTPVSPFPLRFNGGPGGIHAVAVRTNCGDVVVRRKPGRTA